MGRDFSGLLGADRHSSRQQVAAGSSARTGFRVISKVQPAEPLGSGHALNSKSWRATGRQTLLLTFAHFQIVPDGHGLEAGLVANVEVGVVAISRLQHSLKVRHAFSRPSLAAFSEPGLGLQAQTMLKTLAQNRSSHKAAEMSPPVHIAFHDARVTWACSQPAWAPAQPMVFATGMHQFTTGQGTASGVGHLILMEGMPSYP